MNLIVHSLAANTLDGSEKFLSNNHMQAQATKSEATVIRAPLQRLKNVIEIQGPQNIQNSQSKVSNPLKTTLKVTRKGTPKIINILTTRSTGIARSERNLISPTRKVRTLVRFHKANFSIQSSRLKIALTYC